MKKIGKLIVLFLIIFIMLFQNLISIANVIDIGETKYIERGDLGFYSIQYWNNAKQQWMYVTYSKTYYTDNNGEKRIAYCTTPDLDGVGWLPGEVEGYNTTIQEKLSNTNLWRVFKNGYPYVTPNELGVETDDDAYLATKQAAYFILRNRSLNEVYDYFRPGQIAINGESLVEIQRRGQKVVDAIYKLVNMAYNGQDEMLDPQIEKIGEFDIKENNSSFCTQKYKLTSAGSESVVKFNSIYSTDSEISKDIEICNESGEKIDKIHNGDEFYVRVNKALIKNDAKIRVDYTITHKNYPVFFAKSTVENTQDYLMMAEEYDDKNENISFEIDAHKSSFELTKVDSISKKSIQNVVFNLKYKNGEDLGDFTTNEEGKIKISNLKAGILIATEVKTVGDYVLDNSSKEIELKYGEKSTLTLENSHKEGKIRIVKTSSDANNITHTLEGSSIQGCKFGIYNLTGNLVEKVTTDKNGIALSKNLRVGKYTIKEIEAGEWYLLNKKEYTVEIKDNEEVVNLDIENVSADPKLLIDKNGPEVAVANKEIKYSYNIKNTGNVALSSFTWYDFLPYENTKITKISTGTYNQNITYNIFYKTNKKDEYLPLEKNLNSNINNYIDVSKVYLEKDEKITEIKACFGDVDVNFESVESPYIFLKADSNIEDNTTIINDTILDGVFKTYKVSSEDEVSTIVENKKDIEARLPRTGY